MKKHCEYILNSILLSLSIILGLSFWLNTQFQFNLFSEKHWAELAKMQASHIPVNINFYIAIGIAIFMFILGLYAIFKPKFRHVLHPRKTTPTRPNKPEEKTIENTKNEQPQTSTVYKPARLNLPKNISAIHQTLNQDTKPVQTQNNDLINILSDFDYQIKTPTFIKGFKPDVFAIGRGEQIIIGGINCDPQKIQNAIKALKDVFLETLEDVEINVFGFILDSENKIEDTPDITILRNLDDVKEFVSEIHNNIPQEPEEEDSFDSYSEYIDTILQYISTM
ncbi:MAG: hypothetical protein MJ156_00795 [Alphaproteobacteria bacterium]|nr:hypothetical protein [Alphaproteobacteria bacterium]